MPKIYGEIQEACLENLASDPSSSVAGRIWHNTAEVKVKTDNGTNKRALIRNDDKAIFGNHGTASNNVRVHRGASALLQFLLGSDTTGEGTPSTSLAQISAKQEGYTDSGKPAAGNAGRIIYVTDLQTFLGDNGSSYVPLGGGGGGGSISWEEGALAPVRGSEYGLSIYQFEAALSQNLYTAIAIPSSYIAGRPIAMKISVYCDSNSGNILLNAVSTLIRNATDNLASTTNQRTTTNAAISLSAGTVTEPQRVTLDITSSTGTINGVAVAAGDLILVDLRRATDTATGDIKFIIQSTEVTLS